MWIALLALIFLSIFIYALKMWGAKEDGKHQNLKKFITVASGIVTAFSSITAILSYCGVGFDDVQNGLEVWLKNDTRDVNIVTPSTDNQNTSAGALSFGEVGSSVFFGAFSADENADPETAPTIEWIVICKDEISAKLLSKYGLIYKPYEEGENATIWLDSSIREWLNGQFYLSALQSSRFIIGTTLYTNSPSFSAEKRMSKDYVYLLSAEEVASLLSGDDCVCKPTADAIVSFRGTNMDIDGDYWYLREEGKAFNFVASVDQNGNITSGGSLNNGGGVLIRPCITISIRDYLAALNGTEIS